MTAIRAAACALALVVAVVLAPASGAEAPTATGWWWSGNVEGLPVQPPPPEVPEGGLYVAGGLSGASGVSALRFALPAGATEPVLTLRVSNSSGTPVIGACPAAGPWEPADGGAFAARAMPDCERASVTAEVAGDTVRIALADLVEGTGLDVVLVPGKDPATGAGATFETSFERPGGDALTFTASEATVSPPTTFSSSPATTAAFASPSPPPRAPLSPVAPPAPVAFTPAENVTAAPVDPDTVSTPAIPGEALRSAQPTETSGRAAGLILGGVVLATWLLMTRTDLGARLTAISGGSTGDVRGIGRFAAPRDTSPPAL